MVFQADNKHPAPRFLQPARTHTVSFDTPLVISLQVLLRRASLKVKL